MSNRISMWTKRHPLVEFILLAYAFLWIVQIPLALQAQGFQSTRIPFGLYYLSAFGPMLAAFLVTWLTNFAAVVKELFAGITRCRVRYVWWLVAVAPLIITGLIVVVNWLLHGELVNLDALVKVWFLPYIAAGVSFFWVLTIGLGEETGWREFALPRLQWGLSALSATLLSWIIWAVLIMIFFKPIDLSTRNTRFISFIGSPGHRCVKEWCFIASKKVDWRCRYTLYALRSTDLGKAMRDPKRANVFESRLLWISLEF
ncbi:MAG: hypothetical protein GTO18_09420 [Anaerolineales bacterium]|nr:hypothetical protein [Anaerolineales bacterium]